MNTSYMNTLQNRKKEIIMNKKILIGIGIVAVAAVVGVGIILKRKLEPDFVDDDDFDFDDEFDFELDDLDEIDDEEEILEIDDEKVNDITHQQLEKIVNEKGYEKSDFSDEQLSTLRCALQKQWDISDAINPVYNSDQMSTIIIGVKNGYDSKYFADPKFNSEQMLRIIQGLSNNIDVTKYNNPNYSEHQMCSIMIGLLADVDIEDLFNRNTDLNIEDPHIMRELIFAKIISENKDPYEYLNSVVQNGGVK